jgi:hypothetical protein
MLNRSALTVVCVWILMVTSGAVTTGLLRASTATQSAVSTAFQLHRLIGSAVGVWGLIHLARLARRDTWWWVTAGLVSVAVGLGWLGARSLAPSIAALHGFVSGFAVIGLAFAGIDWSDRTTAHPAPAWRPTRWMQVSARSAVLLFGAQVAIGALLRHQQIGVTPHLFVGGLAVLALLAPAAAVLQDPVASPEGRRSARWAVAAVIVQVVLGAAVLLMIAVGPPSITAWLAVTVGHVTVGTLTLLATARFAVVVTRARQLA